MQSLVDQFSSSLGRRDQEPNKILAITISTKKDMHSIQALEDVFEYLATERQKNDCTLILAYVAEENPSLLAPHVDFLLDNLQHTINRVIWGSMIALYHIASFCEDKLYQALPSILDVMDTGTVITRDYGFKILVTFYKQPKVYPLVLEQLLTAPSNQIGQYTEHVLSVLKSSDLEQLELTLQKKLLELDKEHHRKRLLKNLKVIQNIKQQ